MNCSVITFPGSNCDHDAMFATEYSGWKVKNVWHEDKNLPIGTDLVIIPGGFSYGDYLRSGAIARFSPIMTDVIKFAQKGGYIIGICNGFQILTESQLLPGILLKNKTLSFICKDVHLVVENNQTSFTNKYSKQASKESSGSMSLNCMHACSFSGTNTNYLNLYQPTHDA